jgi:hypothetical protein
MKPVAILVASCVAAFGAAAQDSRPSFPAPTDLPVAVPIYANPTCPIMGKPTSGRIYVDTTFGRIYTCCAPCNKKIREQPEVAHKAAYPKIEKAGNTKCPVSGEDVPKDAPTVILQGREIALARAEHAEAARADAQRTLALALDPKLVDVKNPTDPTNGKPVVPNAVVVIDGKLVRLSSPSSVDDVKKDPSVALKRAEESAATAAAEAAASRAASRPASDR